MKSHYRYAILTTILMVGLCNGLILMSMSPLFQVIMEQYQINRTTVSLLISIVSIMSIPPNLLAGMIIARIGIKKTLLITYILIGAGILTFLAVDFSLLLIIRILFAIGLGLFTPVVATLVMQWFSGRELSLVNGCIFISASIGMSVIMFIVVPLTDIFGWQILLTAISSIPILIAIIWQILSRAYYVREDTNVSDTIRASSSRSPLKSVKYRETLLLAFAFSGSYSLWTALSSWLPTYYNEVFQMPLVKASSITGLMNFSGIIGTIIFSILMSIIGLRKPFFIISGFIIFLAGFGTYLTSNPVIIYISVIAFGICAWGYLPSIFTVAMELPGINPQKISWSIGMVLAISRSVGFTSPIIVGYFRDASGSYLPGFILWSAISLSVFIVGILLPETGPGIKKEAN